MSNRGQVSGTGAVTEIGDKRKAGPAMNTMSVYAASLGGVQKNLRSLSADAHRIAAAPVDRADPLELVEPLVSSFRHQQGLGASEYALGVAHEALGTFLDTFA